MRLKPGDTTPQFVLADIHGQKVSLTKYANTYLLIVFLRFADCPWCNLAIHRLAVEQQLLRDSKCEIVAFIQSSEKDIETSIIDRHNVTPMFPIIADPMMKTYKKFGVEASVIPGLKHHITNIPAWVQSVYKEGYKQTSVDGSFFLAPGAFLISPGKQKIVHADYSSDLYQHESFTKIYDAIAEHELHG